MKILWQTLLLMMVVVLPVHAQRGQWKGPVGRANMQGDRTNCLALVNSTSKQTLDSAESAALVYLREEEKLALDIFVRLQARWGSRVFGNISEVEDRHFRMIKLLLDRYQLQDPSSNNPAGTFNNAGIQELYSSFSAEGEKSLRDALKVSAAIEDLDIHDLANAAQSTDNSDLKLVYGHLRTASENHMRAFVKQLKRAGDTYLPQHIDQAKFYQIIGDAPRKGRSGGSQENRSAYGHVNNTTCPRMRP